MSIILARIDDRLIHGQIVEGWLRVIKANSVIIVSDEVARDKVQQTLLTIAVPDNININSFSIDEAAEKIKEKEFEKKKIMLLFSNPQDVLRFIKKGVKLTSVNVGGMHYTPGKKQILRTLSVDENDILVLKEINKMDVKLEGRVLPGDDYIDVIETIEKSKNQKK
ncbi:MAG: PTS sugar transporter subunit IIB [Endomicrobiales bacterium]|nr:PTS sugar transporter subunit IIB [Endomicrobiales bacterium]